MLIDLCVLLNKFLVRFRLACRGRDSSTSYLPVTVFIQDIRGFLLVDCPTVDFHSIRQATNKQSVSDIFTVYNSRVSQNFTRQISIDKLKMRSNATVLTPAFCLIDFFHQRFSVFAREKCREWFESDIFIFILIWSKGSIMKCTGPISYPPIDYLALCHNHFLWFYYW